MARSGEQYRKLPGRLRGIGYGATVWMGSDHLLLVRTRMFREEYKRFYLRDVQAIVVAKRPRFVVSLRAMAAAFLWLFAWLFFLLWPPGLAVIWSTVGLVLVGAWLVISAAFSCTCRLYTAVSNDELPSLYRTWTARRFLTEVKPWIDELQGRLEGNWVEAMEGRVAGPAAAPARRAFHRLPAALLPARGGATRWRPIF